MVPEEEWNLLRETIMFRHAMSVFPPQKAVFAATILEEVG